MPPLVNHLVKWKGRFFFPDPQKMSEFIEVLAAVKGGNGYVPYYVLGKLSIRTDVPLASPLSPISGSLFQRRRKRRAELPTAATGTQPPP